MKIAIIGGCFTNQHNIPFDRLYHQTIKRKLENIGTQVEIRTIRYERISTCLEKIMELQRDYPFDLLLFHLRAEPIMRMSKLYYKYLNAEGKLKHDLNIPLMNILYSEKFDLLSQRQVSIQLDDNMIESKAYHSLRELNYLAGSLIGNRSFALKALEKTILEIHVFCMKKKLNFLLLGPVSRPFSRFEDNLSEEINRRFESVTKENSINYLNLIKKVSKDKESMFFKNGIHVSQAGHDEIARMICEKLIKGNLNYSF